MHRIRVWLAIKLLQLGTLLLRLHSKALDLSILVVPKKDVPVAAPTPEEAESSALKLAREITRLCVGRTAHDSLVALLTAVVEITVRSVDSADEAEDLITEYSERAADIARRRFLGLVGDKPEASPSVH